MTSDVKTDRRVRRTQQLLRSALVSLIMEKGYERVTVQEILDRADVGRSTFYAHFRDKEDLLRSGFEDIRSAVGAERDAAESVTGARVEFLEPLLAVFQHVGEYRRTWKPLARKGGGDVVIRILRESVTDLVREHFRTQFPGVERRVELEAAIQFVVGSSMGLLGWWLDNEVDYSADELHSIFRGLAVQGVRRFLASSG